MQKLKILIFGAGAVGTYIGGSLAHAGNRVVFVEKDRTVKSLREHGLRLDLTCDGGSSFEILDSSITFVSSIGEAFSCCSFDIAIYALKSFDTSTALEEMKPFTEQIPPIVCLSNGVENETEIAAVLGSEKVIAGAVTSSISRRAEGDIVLERKRGVAISGKHPLSLLAAQAFNQAGLNAHLLQYSADMKWSKMLTNLPANATSAILNMTASEIFAHPGLFRLEMNMLKEALLVMKANHLRVVNLPRAPVRTLTLGIHLPEFIARPIIQKTMGGGRGGKMPSFYIDLHSGRGKSEVAWLNGAVVRFGEKAGVSTKVNRLLSDTLTALTTGQLPLEIFAKQPEKLLVALT